MSSILYYLFIIRFRKLVSKGDFLAIVLLILIYFSVAVIIYINYDAFKNYIYLFVIDIILYHINRKDIELLQLHKSYKFIIFFEYLIYGLPFYIVLFLKQDFTTSIIMTASQIVLINFPRINFTIINYPFNLINPFWHITFRKYKLLLSLPIITIFTYMSNKYDNDNLFYFALIIQTVICCVPSFERERAEEIKFSSFQAKDYFLKQIKNSLVNTFYLIIPILFSIILIFKLDFIIFLAVVVAVPFLNIVLKYAYFDNLFLHQLIFIIMILSIPLFGVPLLLIPFLYRKAIKNLTEIKHA